MGKVALYGMSFRHPKAFEILNRFARRHVDNSKSFETVLGWHALMSELTAFSRRQTAGQQSTAEFSQSAQYKTALKYAIDAHAVSRVLIHKGGATIIFPTVVQASCLAGVGVVATEFYLNAFYEHRPFGDDKVEVVRAQYCSDAVA